MVARLSLVFLVGGWAANQLASTAPYRTDQAVLLTLLTIFFLLLMLRLALAAALYRERRLSLLVLLTTVATWSLGSMTVNADSLEELAGLLGMTPAVLRDTVNRFNRFADAGRDDDFQRGDRAYDRWLGDRWRKHSPTLGDIRVPPFYAIPVLPGDVGTYGGAVTDESARVLRTDGSVIAGLYATGVSTASVMGRTYPGAGCSIGPSFTFAYVAAKAALAAAQPG